MSWDYMTLVSEIDSGLMPTEKWVLFMLAYMRNDETGRCDPSIGFLSKRCGLGTKQTRRILQRLAEKGALRIRPRRSSKGDFTSNLYELTPWNLLPSKGVPPPLQGSTPTPAEGSTYSPPTSNKQKSNDKSKQEAQPDDVFLRRTWGDLYQPPSIHEEAATYDAAAS